MPPKKTTIKKTATPRPKAKPRGSERVPPKAAVKPVERAEKLPPRAAAKPAVPEVSERYWEAVGRRKTAIARVRLFTRGDKGLRINEKQFAEYFRYPHMQRLAMGAIDLMNSADRFRVSVRVRGGGTRAQAEAVRHATARALVLFNPDFRKRLKKAGFLTRDPRMKERKKFGLKKARRAPQWAKR